MACLPKVVLKNAGLAFCKGGVEYIEIRLIIEPEGSVVEVGGADRGG